MHLACATRTPTRAIFAVTDPAEWGPYGGGNAVMDGRARTPEEVAAAFDWPREG